MTTITKEDIAGLVGMSVDQMSELISDTDVQFIEYVIEGKTYLFETTASNSIESILTVSVDLQKKLIAGIAAKVPRPGDSAILEFEVERNKNRGGRLTRLSRDDEVVHLLLTR